MTLSIRIERHNAEFSYAVYRIFCCYAVMCLYAEWHYVEYCYAESCCVKRRYTERRLQNAFILSLY
jgi:hypothetical protein